ncbi:MAG: carboxylesterase family protein [Anaerolineales bacterium]|nr:carboxylesterase family protein [Anaerolineales bacterium]
MRGFVQDELNVYLGIPYGKPPSGSLRFKAPEPQPAWDGVFNAYEFRVPSVRKCMTRVEMTTPMKR